MLHTLQVPRAALDDDGMGLVDIGEETQRSLDPSPVFFCSFPCGNKTVQAGCVRPFVGNPVASSETLGIVLGR